MDILRGEEYLLRTNGTKASLVIKVCLALDGSLTAITDPLKEEKTVQERIKDWQHILNRDLKPTMILETRSQKIFTIEQVDIKGVQVSLCENVELFEPKPNQ